MTEAYPLYWPENRPRLPAHKRERSRFDAGFGQSVREVINEVRLIGGRLPVVSTNVPLRRDGLPLASAKRPADPAAAVYFTLKGRQVCFACDRWDRVEDNIRAVAKTINAMRGIARWGTGDMMDAAFNGFAALPAPGAVEPWHVTLGLAPNATAAEVEGAWKRLARQHHPDNGGDPARMAAINAARDSYRRERG